MGSVKYRGQEILHLDESEEEKLRGREIAYLPQDPFTAFSPLFRVVGQVGEIVPRRERWSKVTHLLEQFGFPWVRYRRSCSH